MVLQVKGYGEDGGEETEFEWIIDSGNHRCSYNYPLVSTTYQSYRALPRCLQEQHQPEALDLPLHQTTIYLLVQPSSTDHLRKPQIFRKSSAASPNQKSQSSSLVTLLSLISQPNSLCHTFQTWLITFLIPFKNSEAPTRWASQSNLSSLLFKISTILYALSIPASSKSFQIPPLSSSHGQFGPFPFFSSSFRCFSSLVPPNPPPFLFPRHLQRISNCNLKSA